MILVERGILHVTCPNGEITAAAGDALFYPRGVRHSEIGDSQKAHEHFYLGFYATVHGTSKSIVRATDHHGRIGEILRWIFSHQTRVVPISEFERTVLVAVLVEEFNRTANDSGKTLSTATRHYIQEHIADPLTLDTLAKVAGLSRFHFLRRYKAETGRTPMQDARDIRAHYARQYIVGSSIPLKEIAVLSGFGDVQLLTRACRQVFNRSPGELRINKVPVKSPIARD